MSGYSAIVRKIRDNYPDLKFEIKRSSDNSINLIFHEFEYMLSISNKNEKWDEYENIIKAMVNNRNSRECPICFEDYIEEWAAITCHKCGVCYCGKCYLNAFKIKKDKVPCPFCNEIDLPLINDDFNALSHYIHHYQTIKKDCELDRKKIAELAFDYMNS
jgi:hypothetical protein